MKKRPQPICPLAIRLGDNLRRIRGNTPLEEFCTQVGLSKSTLARAESGCQNLGIQKIQTICDHLQWSIEQLFSPPPKVDG